MKVLYIEDEPNDARLVERYFRPTEHELAVVANIPDAAKMLEDSPDLILVDLLLNGMRSGYAFVRDLRASGYDHPVIAITGLTLPQDVEQCYSVGCTDILTKPFTIKELDSVIKQYTSL